MNVSTELDFREMVHGEQMQRRVQFICPMKLIEKITVKDPVKQRSKIVFLKLLDGNVFRMNLDDQLVITEEIINFVANRDFQRMLMVLKERGMAA